MNRFHLTFLIIVLLIASLLRFYRLGSNPPSLTWDEAAWGYNAYTLGTDGKDEFGRFLPLVYLESFGDFKPPVYAYLDIIPVKIFGLDEFAVRFPSALFGTLTVLLTYFLVKELFTKAKNLPSLAALIVAISPWHIMLSRAAFEANIASFFIVCGVWLFFLAMRKNHWFLLASATAFILSMYTFNSARIVSPLLALVLIIAFHKQLFNKWAQTLIAGLLVFILILPLARFLTTPQAALRFKEVNIFSDEEIVRQSNQEIANDNNAWWSKIVHNRRWLYTQSFFRHYFDHFNPNYLFIKGDGNPKFSIQSVGELYLWDAPFLIIGFFWLFRKKEGYWWFVPVWMLLGIIPAATARETPHALRTEAIIPTMQLVVAYGLIFFFEMISNINSAMQNKILNIRINYLIFTLCTLFLIFNISYFLHTYYAHYAREYSGEWQYGYKESIKYVSSVASKYNNIYVTEALGRPYVYYAFYLQINPRQFRQQIKVNRDVFGFVDIAQIGKYFFKKQIPIKATGNSLFVNVPSFVPDNARIQKTFLLKNGNPALVAYTL